MKTFSKYALIVIFAAALFLPHILSAIAPDEWSKTADENRMMAEFPAFSQEDIQSWPGKFEEWYNDHLPFRNSLIRLNNRVEYYAFRNSSDKSVVIGKDGWLFYNMPAEGDPIGVYEGKVRFDQDRMQAFAEKLQACSDTLKAQGREFILFIAPNKERVYSEYMPDYLGEPAENWATDELMAYLQENTNVRVVYAYDALMEAKQLCPQLGLYYETDTHWNNIGAYIGCRELLSELGYSTPALDKVVILDQGPINGDLRKKLNIGILADSDVHKYLVKGYNRTRAEQVENVSDAQTVYRTTGTDQRKILIIRDSFGEAMMPVISAFFDDCVFMHYKSYTPETIERYQADIVVWQLVERNVDRMMDMKIVSQE